MSAAVGLRDDFTAADLRRLAGKTKEADQARRLLALAAVYDGMDRGTAAQIGGMDRQTLRDWAHRFNDQGPAGLINVKPVGRRQKLSAEQQEALRQLVEAGPDPEKHGVVRWRCVDLQRWSPVRCQSVDSRDRPAAQAAWLLPYQRPPAAPGAEC